MIPIIEVDLLPDCGLGSKSRVEAMLPWTADRIYILRGLDPKTRAFLVAHELEHVRQARRYRSPAEWRAAYLKANGRGYFHNRFEHKANKAAFAAIGKGRA